MKKLMLNVAAIVLGFLVGQCLMGTVVYAQSATKIDPALKPCWTQPTNPTQPDLTALNAMKVRVTYDAQLTPAPAPVDVQFICEGTSSPYLCTVKNDTPASVLVAGTHRFIVEGSALDPADGTYGPYVVLTDFSEPLRDAAAPSPGSNGHLIKRIFTAILAAIGAVLLFHWI